MNAFEIKGLTKRYDGFTLENVDRTVGLVPYFLHRPDLAHEEIPGVRRIRNYPLARVWNKRASK